MEAPLFVWGGMAGGGGGTLLLSLYDKHAKKKSTFITWEVSRLGVGGGYHLGKTIKSSTLAASPEP